MTPRLVNADQPAFWAAATAHPRASLFSSAPWQQAVARTYGFALSAAVGGGAGGTAALLFSRVADLRGERIACGPFCDYCDPLVTDAAGWEAVIGLVLALRLPVTLRCLRTADLVQRTWGFTVAGRAAWHGIDLTRPEAALWAGLDGSARQNLRKAQRLGITVREGSSLEDVRTFFDMHCEVRRTKYRLLPQPFALFANLHAAFAAEDRLRLRVRRFVPAQGCARAHTRRMKC
jgi:hypothetical protein